MERTFETYKVQLLEKEFSNDYLTCNQSALITFFDAADKEIDTLELGFLDEEALYAILDDNLPAKFDKCYIKDFSLEKYKISIKNEFKKIKFVQFSAELAFFDFTDETISTIDFSDVTFEGEKAKFSNCVFANRPVIFKNADFVDCQVEFDYVLFNNGNADFSNVKFGNGEVSFKNAIFKEGIKKFNNIQFGFGHKNFTNAEFGNGDVDFSETDFHSGKVSFKVARFGEGKLDFAKAKFGKGDVIFEKTEFGPGNTSFRSTTFDEGLVDFTRSEFGKGELSFEYTLFGKGDIYFVGTDFSHGKISFKFAEFGEGKVDFHYAKFGEGDVIFERTKFDDGGVDFRACDFHEGKVTFNRAEFGDGDVIFEACELKKGTITFRRSTFGNGVFNFETAQMPDAQLIIDDVSFGQGKVSFKRSKFGLLSLNSCQLNNYFDLRVEKCGKLDLSETIVKDLIDMRPFEYKIDIQALDISGMRLLGRIFLDWKSNNVKELIYQQDASYRIKSEQFRILKQNYNVNGQYNDEDEAYVEFKRTEAKADLQEQIEKNPKMKWWAYIQYAAQWLIFDKMGLYATNPARVLQSVLIVYIIYSLLYVLGSLIGIGTIGTTIPEAMDFSTVGRSFYMSVVIFFTIGFGDYYPLGYLRILAGIEGFSGVFLMSYFVVAFVRKILR